MHIYRLISTNTIEENILRKSDQKRQLDWLAIQSGAFNTEVLAKALEGAPCVFLCVCACVVCVCVRAECAAPGMV